jgi:hypothetical protein
VISPQTSKNYSTWRLPMSKLPLRWLLFRSSIRRRHSAQCDMERVVRVWHLQCTFNTTLDNVVPIDTQNDWKNEGVSVSLKTWKTGSSIPTVVAGIPLPFNLSTGHQIITITIKDPVTDATIGQAFVDYGTNGGLGIWGPLQGNSGGSDGIWFPGNGLDDQANDIFNAQFDAMNSDPRMNYRYGAGH